MMPSQSRRSFLKTSAAAALGAGLPLLKQGRVRGANERLNIGMIGIGGRGSTDLAAVSSQNIVALCDVNDSLLKSTGARYLGAKRYTDYRQLLEQKEMDAVVIATPDHHHAPAAMRALRRGLHVYCEKPLTHTVEEAHLIRQLAAKMKVATQMGTQNHEHPGYLRLVEMLQSGVIGDVHQVHVVTDRPGRVWPQGIDKPVDKPPIPASLKWDLWLGPAAERDYHPAYVPFKWRGWWDFGTGAIGDMAIHLMDPAFWALELGGPVKVTSKGPPPHPDCGPISMETRFEFGARGKRPPVEVFWYEGDAKPKPDIASELPMNGSLFIGAKGRISIAHDKFPKLLPVEQFEGFKGPAPYLAKSPGHHQQWIDACKTGARTGSNFQYAGPFTEILLLANVSYRAGKTIEYDPASMKIINIPNADSLLTKSYRKGWEIKEA